MADGPVNPSPVSRRRVFAGYLVFAPGREFTFCAGRQWHRLWYRNSLRQRNSRPGPETWVPLKLFPEQFMFIPAHWMSGPYLKTCPEWVSDALSFTPQGPLSHDSSAHPWRDKIYLGAARVCRSYTRVNVDNVVSPFVALKLAHLLAIGNVEKTTEKSRKLGRRIPIAVITA